MNFLETLDFLIRKHNITKTELARQIEISEGTIRQWYNGKMPTIDKIIKLSKYFNISIDELVGIDNITKNDIQHIYNKLTPEDKAIVDNIFNRYRNNGNLSSISKIG